jgi:uncharacterized protein (TIGR00297 family)
MAVAASTLRVDMALPSVSVILAGCSVAILFAVGARMAGALSVSGAISAGVVGSLTVAAGWQWGAVLLVFFTTSTALSRVGHAAKLEHSQGRTEKTGARDAVQVVANGGIFAAGAFLAAVVMDPRMAVASLGAIAAANGDTWATEAGLLWGRAPRSVMTGKRVPPGTSGAITPIGTTAGLAGVLLIAASAAMLQIHQNSFGAIVAGGAAGWFLD